MQREKQSSCQVPLALAILILVAAVLFCFAGAVALGIGAYYFIEAETGNVAVASPTPMASPTPIATATNEAKHTPEPQPTPVSPPATPTFSSTPFPPLPLQLLHSDRLRRQRHPLRLLDPRNSTTTDFTLPKSRSGPKRWTSN
jgi:hypothetical protein